MSPADPTLVHDRFGPRRGAVRATTWWGRAWVRAAEEAAYDERDAKQGRTIARSGKVGAIGVEPGAASAVVEDTTGAHAVRVGLEQLRAGDWEAFLDELAARAGHAAALLAGELPHELMEEVEAAGVEVLPYGSELECVCPCESWVQPCRHALAVIYQLGWWVDEDPFVLLHLRGRSRAEVLAGLNDRYDAREEVVVEDDDPDDRADPGIAEAVRDAAERARMLLGLAEHAPTGDGLADAAVAAYDVAAAALVSPVGR
ncbi:SWIM zinc finger family protein [Nocardioides massiliensis]|uniref:Zn finger protein n=1 Tax=Nocardioides massiliensis TaxID=1325935 RepID=A0ABT9NLF1_9ACTN|nr:hypothetical protein [Nocardioides massiliensis]MDP9821248.1 putative Zn finger protein [Nocardioides massiliensis]